MLETTVTRSLRESTGPVLITGGAGFIGSNLADHLASEGFDIIVYDSLCRKGVENNLKWLQERHRGQVTPVIADIRDRLALGQAVRQAKVVFHLAAQVAVTTSLVSPREDFEVNLAGTHDLLEHLREKADQTPLIFASTNKVYGNLPDIALTLHEEAYRPVDPAVSSHGISEGRPISFHTPYGCSKGGADQYVLDYSRSFGIPTAVMRMSCIYGPRQMGTEDQGWVAHFVINALQGRPITIYGDGYQVRDILHVSDVVSAYVAAWRGIGSIQGKAFNLGGGPGNAVSLRQLLAYISSFLGQKVQVKFADWREGDQYYYVSDTRQVRNTLGLPSPIPWRAGVADLAQWLQKRHHSPAIRAVDHAQEEGVRL